jgi:hypothetical protein
MAKEKSKKQIEELRREFFKTTLNLSTSAFGLVAALAWNEVIKELITKYIQPFFGASSGILSLVTYALLVTFLAVFVTYNLSKLSEKKG